MDDFEPVQRLPGMKCWECSYDGPDGRYSIGLYGSSAEQVLEDNCEALPGLTVDGERMGVVPFNGNFREAHRDV